MNSFLAFLLSFQTEHHAAELVCASAQEAQVDQLPAESRGMALGAWWMENIRNKNTLKDLNHLSTLQPALRGDAYRTWAAENGVEDCALAAWWDSFVLTMNAIEEAR